MRRRSILITGASGRLGASLAQALARDHDIVQLDLHEPAIEEQRKLGRVHAGSITDPAVVSEAMEGVDAVIHAAAIPGTRKPYHQLLETNVTGTFNLLEEAGNRGHVEQVVYISSIMYHGLVENPPPEHLPRYLPIDEDHPSLAVDYYGCTKAQAEYWCEKYVRRFRKPVVVIRPPWIVPLDQEPSLRAGPAPDRPHLNDYIGTSDLIAGIACAMDYHPKDGFDCFLLHAEDQRSATPSLELVERFFPGIPVDREKLSACEGFGALVDCGRATDRLGWSPSFRCMR